jgi:hypothetical protein
LEAVDYPVLKVGLKTDEETISAVRSVTNKPLRVDANEGWTDKEEAVRKINWLKTQVLSLSSNPCPLTCSRKPATYAAKSTFPSSQTKLAPGLRRFLDSGKPMTALT